MNRWIFVVSGNMYRNSERVHPSELLQERIKRKHWPLRKSTPGRADIGANDDVIFYLGAPEYTFAGRAKIEGAVIASPLELSDFGPESIDRPEEFTMPFTKVELWRKPVNVRKIASHLNLFPNKNQWGGCLQGAVVRLGDEDFKKILAAAEEK